MQNNWDHFIFLTPLPILFNTARIWKSLQIVHDKRHALIQYILDLRNAKNQGSTALFLKSIFSCKRMVCEFYSIDPCSYFARYLWVHYSYPIYEKFCWFSIENWLIWYIESPHSTKLVDLFKNIIMAYKNSLKWQYFTI